MEKSSRSSTQWLNLRILTSLTGTAGILTPITSIHPLTITEAEKPSLQQLLHFQIQLNNFGGWLSRTMFK